MANLPHLKSLCAFLLSVTALSGCATLRPAPTQGFISEEELDAVSLTREGLGYLQTGRFVDAQLAFYQVLSEYPDSENVVVGLAAAQVGNADGEGALETLAPLYRKNPLNVKIVGLMLSALVLEGREREGIGLLEKGLSGSVAAGELSGMEQYSRLLAEQYFRLGFEEAAACYSDLAYQAQKAPTEAVKHGRVLLARGFAESSMELLKSVPAVGSQSVEQGRLVTLALAAYGLGKFDEAHRYATEAAAAGAQDGAVEPKLISLLSLAKRRAAAAAAAAESATPVEKPVKEEGRLVVIVEDPDDAADAAEEAKLVLTARQVELMPKLVWPPSFIEAVEGIERIED